MEGTEGDASLAFIGCGLTLSPVAVWVAGGLGVLQAW